MSSRQKLITLLKRDLVRTIFVFAIFIFIPVIIVSFNAGREVDVSADYAHFDQEFISMTQTQPRQAGFNFCIPQCVTQSQDELQVTFVTGDMFGTIRAVSDLILIDKNTGTNIAFVSSLTLAGNSDYGSDFIQTHAGFISSEIKWLFKAEHEIEVAAVLFNFGIGAWDPIYEKHIVISPARQVKNLVEQLQTINNKEGYES